MKFQSDTYPEVTYTEDQTKRIGECLDSLVSTIASDGRKCASCRKTLDMDFANIYDHDGGWRLIGDIPKQWISFHCKCGYETSLNKLQSGLSRLLYKDSFK